MIILATRNPFFSAYTQSDGFGKSIFIGLFLLSLISWTVLIYKVYLSVKVKKCCLAFEKIFAAKKDEPLQLSVDHLKGDLNPYLEIYKVLKQQTFDVLGKNRFYVQKDAPVCLSPSDLQLVESQIAGVISKQCKWMEKHLFLLPTIVTLGPFLGLLGTVWGILITFSELNAKTMGSANGAILSGLSMALATTVLGLLVAIPALVAHNYIRNVHKELRKDMEHFSLSLLGALEMQYRKVDVC